MEKVDSLIQKLRLISQENGYVVYDILIRKAGFGVFYFRDGFDRADINSRVVFAYYPTFTEMIEGEIKAWKKGDRK